MENKKRKHIRPRNTLRIIFVFVAVMLCIQLGFSAIYLYQNHNKTAELRQEAITAYQTSVDGYYAKAEQIIEELRLSSTIAELGYRQTISQSNLQKVYGLVTLLQKTHTANNGDYADIFVYFPASNMLYSQLGLCNTSDPANPRYVHFDLDTLLALDEGAFNICEQTVVTVKGQYKARYIGFRSKRELIFVTCPTATLMALSEAVLKLSGAEAAYFDEFGMPLAATEALSTITLDSASDLYLNGQFEMKPFSFYTYLVKNGTLLIGFNRTMPNEVIMRNNLMIIAVNIFCLLAIAFFSFTYYRQLYQPVQSVIAKTSYDKRTESGSEFQFIAQQLSDSLREAVQIGEQYRLERQTRTLNDLAMGLYVDDELLPKLSKPYVVLSLVCENTDGTDDYQIFTALLQRLEQTWNARVFYRQGKQHLLLIRLDEKPLSVLAEDLREAAADCCAQIALSNPHEMLTELHIAMDDAINALLYQPATYSGDDYRVILCGDTLNTVLYKGAGGTLDVALSYCVESSNVEGCRALLQPLYEKNRNNSVMAQRELCIHLVDLLQNGKAGEERMQELLFIRNSFRFVNMWKKVLEQLEGMQSDASQEDNASQQMERYICENFNDPNLSLQSVADHMKWSYSYTSRFVKQMNGNSFTNYVNTLRIEEAKRLLTDSDLQVNEISLKVGFTVFSSFSRTFKKATGFSPSEYRNKIVR